MKIKTFQKKIIVCSISFLIVFFLSPNKVIADESTLSISPSIFEIQTKPPSDVWTPFSITNKSNQPVLLTVGYKPFDPQASENGKVVFLKNGVPITGEDKKIFDKMQIVDDKNISLTTISLGPKQEMKLRLHIRIPENEPSSDYYFSLLFLENNNKSNQNISNNINDNQKSSSLLQLGIGLNVLLAIGDKEIPQANISNFSTNWIQDSGPVYFSLSVFNQGSHFIAPYGYILIKNMFGQTIGRITIPSTIVLAGTGRTFSSNTIYPNATSGIQSTSEIIWPENFLLGMYTATLSFSLSKDGPTYIRNLHFFAFPFVFLLITIITVAIIFIIYLRVKKKLF
jgi:hypothetical protein